MRTSGCSPSKMCHGWIYLTWRPISWWNVDERFRTKRRILGKKKSELSKICEIELFKFWKWRSRQEAKNIEGWEIGRSRQEVSKEFLMVEFQLIFGFDTYGPRRRERGFQIWEQKTDAHLTRRSSSGDEDSSSQHRCPQRYLRGPVHAHSKQWI